jgi:protein-disulfide isomerase
MHFDTQTDDREEPGEAAPPPARGRRIPARPAIAAAVVLALVVVGVVLGVVFNGGPDIPARGSLANALPGAAGVQDLFAGIPQQDNILGNPRAPVTLVVYFDLQSPACRQFQTHVFPQLLSRYVRRGSLRIEQRLMPFIDKDSERGRAAAIGAGEQQKFFDFVELLYDNQGAEKSGWLDNGMVRAAAASIPGLDVRLLLRDRNSQNTDDVERAFDAYAAEDRVTATPTVLVGKSGREMHRVMLTGPTDERAVVAALEAALR